MSMAKADSGWDSAIIDPYGRVIKKAVLPDGGPALLVADVPVGGGNTIVSRFGDWFGWVCVVGMFGLVGVGFVTRRRARAA